LFRQLKKPSFIFKKDVYYKETYALLVSRMYHVRDYSGKPTVLLSSSTRTCSEKPDPPPAGHDIKFNSPIFAVLQFSAFTISYRFFLNK
jgi:hypothetical protein